jgi:hypothetical protein
LVCIISVSMEVKEHFYADDPSKGPADARTTLPGVEYFFLGNGLIQAAIQVCGAPGATAAGLLIMDPERLGPKRRALTFDPISGISSTQITVIEGRNVYQPAGKSVRARWVPEGLVPRVEVAWRDGPFRVSELFCCPDRKTPRLIRQVTLSHLEPGECRARVSTGIKGRFLEKSLRFQGRENRTAVFEYRILHTGSKPTVRLSLGASSEIDPDEARYWAETASWHASDLLLDRFFSAAKFGLRAAVANSGKLDGGIWQYNLEWVRDQAFIAMALAMSGQFRPARAILDRLLDRFVSKEGATMDSSRLRPWEESEFDQNGVLLFALENYINWTGDTSLLSRHRAKIIKAAEFPLRKVFRHPGSGLLSNRREFWERHGAHGIRDGMELAHQLFVSMGLDSAARLARRMGDARKARAWRNESARLKKTALGRGRFSLVENGRLIKRRDTDGRVQAEVRPLPDSLLPVQAPLFEKGRHLLNPDTSAALPIAWEFVDPAGRVARRTLASLESLWDQRWTGGGYGRYHVTSEPDSPGPWPFASLFVARAQFEAGNDRKVRRVLEWLGRLPGSRAGTWFEFYGPRPVPPYPQVGIVPWVWAEMLFLFIHHILGVRPSEKSLRLRPRLLRGLKSIEASVRLRGGRIEMTVRKARRREKPGYTIEDEFHPYRKAGIEIPLPADSQIVKVEAIVPS